MATTYDIRRVKQVWKLRNERGIVFLESTTRRIARVLGGTVFHSGDWVERPAGISWEEALATDEEGHSVLSPFGLELVFDAKTRTSVLGPLPLTLLPEEARERDLLVRDILSVLHPEDIDQDGAQP